MGLISTNSFTMTEHSEKKNEDNVASKIPKNGHAKQFCMSSYALERRIRCDPVSESTS